MAHKREVSQAARRAAAALFVLLILAGCASGLSIPDTGAIFGQAPGQQGTLGKAFAASGVDQNGCPVDQAAEFKANQSIYVGFETSQVPQGTFLYARLSRQGQPLADSREIVSDRSISACIWFVFRAAQPAVGMQPGSYQADLFVNKKHAASLTFTVKAAGASAGANSGANSGADGGTAQAGAVSGGGFFGEGNQNVSGVELSNLVTTDRVDDSGCPGDSIVGFRSDQPVYAAYDPFLLPAGTQMYAILLRGDRLVETTQKITAEKDLHSCIWFKFDTGSKGGLQPGSYAVQIFINGSRADSVQFSVR